MKDTIRIADPAKVQYLMHERHGAVGFYEGMTWSSEQWAERARQKAAIEAELLAADESATIEELKLRVATLEAMNRNANGHIGELSDQIAAAAARRVKIKEKANQLHGAMKFILAFYEPQNYLDTEAWKSAEAGARHAVKEYAALMVEEA